MKMKNYKKMCAGILALVMSVGMLTGCDKNKGETETETNSDATISTAVDVDIDDVEHPTGTTRAVAEGDVHAIYKLSGEPTEDFSLAYSDNMITAYLNGIAKIEVFGTNYKEDFIELAGYAESACVNMKYQNMMLACDTEFETPVDTKIAGFDAVSYSYEIIANEFDENNEKKEIARHKGKMVFFYSDEDVYYINCQSAAEAWDESLPKFETFLNSVKIDKNAKEPENAVNADQGEILHDHSHDDEGSETAE